MAVAATVVALAADIPSLVALEWECLVALEWECLVALEWECAALSCHLRWDGCQCSASATVTSIEMIVLVASTVSMTATSIEMIDSTGSTASTTSTTTSSLSMTSAFRGGGVGAGVHGGAAAGAGATHTDITAATVPAMDTAIAVDLEWPSYNAGSLGPAITMAPSMESWGLGLEEQFGPTSATVDTKADLVSSR